MEIVAKGGIDLFKPTEEQAIALCITTLYKKVYESNKKFRKTGKGDYSDAEYDSIERSLMIYCNDYESLL